MYAPITPYIKLSSLVKTCFLNVLSQTEISSIVNVLYLKYRNRVMLIIIPNAVKSKELSIEIFNTFIEIPAYLRVVI